MAACPGTEDPRLIDLHRFHFVDRTTRELIRAWYRQGGGPLRRNADVGHDEWREHDHFEGFIYTWIAFNGWAMTVCAVDTDELSVNVVGSSTLLQRRFLALLEEDDELRTSAQAFQSMWPIFSDRDLHRSAVLAEIEPGTSRRDRVPIYLRSTYWDEHGKERPIGYRLRCGGDHGLGRSFPLDWPHSLSAIYQVRCNLFHGYKGMNVRDDIDIVSAAYRVLYGAIRGLGLLD